jgi:hypothetical protein
LALKNLLLARPLVLGAARLNRSLERTAASENMTFSWTDPFTPALTGWRDNKGPAGEDCARNFGIA